MRHMAAYLMLVAGGNTSPSASDVAKLLGSAEIAVDEARLAHLMTEMAGKDVEELMEMGKAQLLKGGLGGGGGGAAPVAVEGGDAPAPKVEKVVEEEVDALAGGMDMFGGDAGGGDY
jgi:large subunit ribosomal protein LP2